MVNLNFAVSEQMKNLKEQTGLEWRTLLRYGIDCWIRDYGTETSKDGKDEE